MPVVQVDPNKYDRHELESAPADPSVEGDEQGYVMLRPLPYGMKLKIRDESTKMFMHTKTPTRKKGKMTQAQAPDEAILQFESTTEASNYLTFAYCIGDHNLLDLQHNKIDFSSPMGIKQLDPKVGSEIEVLIDDLNRGEDEESFEDFQQRLSSSLEEKDLSKDTGETS